MSSIVHNIVLSHRSLLHKFCLTLQADFKFPKHSWIFTKYERGTQKSHSYMTVWRTIQTDLVLVLAFDL